MKLRPFGFLPGSFLFSSFCVLNLAFFAEVPAWAQAQRRTMPDAPARSYSIRGSVRSAADDQPMQLVRVDLTRFTGETLSTAFTRSNGDFEFSGLGTGEYIIDIKHDGFEPLREKVEIMNASRAGVFIFLKPLGVRAPIKPGAVSARELALPKKALEAYNKGMEQLALKGAPEASLRHFDKALDALATYYEAHHMRGIAYFQLGKMEEAEKDFRASIDKSGGKYPDPYFGLAAMETSAKRFDEAIGLAHQGLAVDHEAWRGYFELARAQMGLNRVEDAAKSIAEARRRKQDFADIYLVSANINMRRQDAVALLADLDEFLKLKPDGPMADQARKIRESVRSRVASAQAQQGTPPPAKKPQ